MCRVDPSDVQRYNFYGANERNIVQFQYSSSKSRGNFQSL